MIFFRLCLRPHFSALAFTAPLWFSAKGCCYKCNSLNTYLDKSFSEIANANRALIDFQVDKLKCFSTKQAFVRQF